MNDKKFLLILWRKSRLFGFLLLTAISLCGTGCSSGPVLYKPDFDDVLAPNENLMRPHTRVYQVIDERKVEPHFAGEVKSGLMNTRVPYRLTLPVSEFVRRMVDGLIDSTAEQVEFTPITIHIDQFEVYEKTHALTEYGYFDCRLRFIFPITADSFAVARLASRKSIQKTDVTGSLKNLINEGMRECTTEFIENYYDPCEKYLISRSDSSKQANFQAVQEQIAGTESSPSPAPFSKAPAANVEASTHANLGISYYKGGKVKRGITVSYNLYRQKKHSQLQPGVGYALTQYKIINRDNFLAGQFLNFGAWIGGRYYFSESGRGFYIEGNIKIAAGSENIDSGLNNDERFFVGPILEEKLGINIMNIFNIETGFFQLKLAGSRLLPDDTGYNLGIRFGL